MFELLKRPRLVRGIGNSVLMIGELKSSFSLDSSRSRISIFRLDLNSLEWDEASRMPIEIYRRFQGLGKFKVFGSGARVCFSAKRVEGLTIWDCTGGESEWRWIKCESPADGDGFYRGFIFEAHLTALPGWDFECFCQNCFTKLIQSKNRSHMQKCKRFLFLAEQLVRSGWGRGLCVKLSLTQEIFWIIRYFSVNRLSSILNHDLSKSAPLIVT